MLRQQQTSLDAEERNGDVRIEFEGHATEVIGHLQTALAGVLSATSAVAVRNGTSEIRKPSDLQKILQLDTALAWSIYRATHSEDPFRTATLIPGLAALTRFLNATEKFGVSKEVTERAVTAFRDFERMVEVQGGDRASFISMASDFDAELSSAADLKQRRAAFRANSHIHGIQVRTIVSCTMVRPNAEGRLDGASIRGHVGVRQLRRNPVLATEFKWGTMGMINTTTAVPGSDSPRPSEPLDPPAPGEDGPEAALQRMGLMRKYCSEPLPSFRTFESNGVLCAQLVSPGLGNAKACDVFVGQLARGYAPGPLGSEEGGRSFTTILGRPASLFYRDLLIHSDAWKGPAPSVKCFTAPPGDGLIFDEYSRLSGYGEVVELGKGPDVLHIAEAPQYAEMVGESLERLGWNYSKFRIFRFRWEFPVLHALVRVVFNHDPV